MAQRLYKQANRGGRTATSSSIYKRVTDQILSSLARGVVPWRKPWKGREFLPCNAVSKRTYNGVNLFLLGLAPFLDHRWMTVRQGVSNAIQFGSDDYSREELVAELTSAFVCAEIGLDNSLVLDASSYIDGWLNALSRDPSAVVHASSQARHAADYMLGKCSLA